jgi:BirA family transcriptional regulator, biotin operon repressor / biotin---[acetyl-CoA-carboxylase] ligase
MDKQGLEALLADLPLGGIQYYPTISSTNDVALTWAENGAVDFSLVIADHQSAGRGRFQRRWVTQPGSALAFSLILRPTSREVECFGFFSALAAIAVCDTLEKSLNLSAEIKWPNDVLLNRRKTCGILVEAVWNGSNAQAIVIGVGVNVAPSSVPPESEVLFPATCVETEFGRPVIRELLLKQILAAMFQQRGKMVLSQFRLTWESQLAFRGEWVRLEGAGRDPLVARIEGIDEDASLRVQSQDGKIHHIAAGEIHLRPAENV